jgi:hypothetical protein
VGASVSNPGFLTVTFDVLSPRFGDKPPEDHNELSRSLDRLLGATSR